MKKMLISALLAGQILGGTAPAFAQSYAPVRETETGTFGGIRVRIPFGGGAQQVRAGFAFAPTTRTDFQDGRARTRIGEGLEFGINGRGPMQFSLAGTPVNRLVQGGDTGSDGRRLGISTLGWIAIGVGATAIIVVSAAAICISDSDCFPDE